MRNPARLALAAALGVLLLAGAAQAQPADAGPANDPLEGVNRMVFDWNLRSATGLLAAAAAGYAAAVPAPLRDDVHQVLQTLREPVYAASGLVTADLAEAWNATARFTLNATLGRLGSEDVAAGMGYPPVATDLALELCHAGLWRQPVFLELPLLGATTTRDAAARLSTNVALYTVLGSYFYPYYILDQLDRYLSAPPPPAAPLLAGDPYLAQRTAYLARRWQGCRVVPPG